MLDIRQKMLVTSVRKLIRRNATKNIQTILDKTHAADIAYILKELDPSERTYVLDLKISIEKKSEIVSHLDEDVQKEVVQLLEKEQVIEIVEQMETDDAADLLGNLPVEESQNILDSMESEEKQEVADLMKYPEDTAGGLMSSEHLAYTQDLRVSDVIKKIQENENEASVAFYIYVIDEIGRLTGVVSLKEIILSKPHQTLKEIMTIEVISVPLEMDQEQVSQVVERYDFLSVPVVDDKNILMGVITVDDIIDVIREEAQENLLSLGSMVQSDDETLRGRIKSRIPWSLVTFAGGLICYYFIWSLFYDKSTPLWLSVSSFLPISLALGATIGMQSTFSVVSLLIAEQGENKKIKKLISQEFASALVFGCIFGVISFGLGCLAGESWAVASFMAISLFLQVVFSVFAGSMIPVAMKKIGGDPAVASVSVFLALSNIFSVLITYGLAYRFLEL